ncbi:MAG: tRNA pseudouridine(55) synthase TruB [Gemmatimonadota bacterium]
MSPHEAGFVVPIDKPVGPTSHDVVGAARKALSTRRVGHTGTLDPFASGLLMLCVGPATRIAEYLSGLDKSYEATARLGEITNTDDLEGEVVERHDGWRDLDEVDITRALAAFVGEIDQVPPQYSAKKVGGEAMYRKARRGEHVVLEANRIRIDSVELLSVEFPAVRFRMRCSTGTYVRALARDLGEALGVGAHLTQLRRTAVGAFAVDHAIPMPSLADPSEVERVALTPLQALAHLPTWEVDTETARRLAHGQRVPYSGPESSDPVAVGAHGGLLAVGIASEGVFKPSKVFV